MYVAIVFFALLEWVCVCVLCVYGALLLGLRCAARTNISDHAAQPGVGPGVVC